MNGAAGRRLPAVPRGAAGLAVAYGLDAGAGLAVMVGLALFCAAGSPWMPLPSLSRW
ncbi:hypothetical protein GCM10009678_26060 [Actinomadura kijaniata]